MIFMQQVQYIGPNRMQQVQYIGPNRMHVIQKFSEVTPNLLLVL